MKQLEFTSDEKIVHSFIQVTNSSYSNDGSIPENLTGALELACKAKWRS